MPRPISEISADLQSLSPTDFDMSRVASSGIEQLNALCDELRESYSVELVAPLLFQTMERLEVCDLGSPRPIVHTLESMPGYEGYLVESFSRKPTPLSAWMANRVVNAGDPRKDVWIKLLKSSLENSLASVDTRAEVMSFLEFQGEA